MNNKLSFRKTPLALAIAGLTLSMGVQADSAFQYGRWAGGGSTGPGACTAGIGAGACNQDETNVQRVLAAVAGEVPVVPPEEVPDGQWVIYTAFGGERVVTTTGRGTLILDPNNDGTEGGTVELVGVFSDTGEFNFPGNFEDTGDRVPFTAFTAGEGNFDSFASLIPNFDNSSNFNDNTDNDYADGYFNIEGFGYGNFVAGQPTLFIDMVSLKAGNISAEYGGFAPNSGHDVSFNVNFGLGTFSSSFTEGGGVDSFTANGVINGADFSSTSVGRDAITGFVDGTFFGDDAAALGGHFDVSDGEGSVADIFGAVKGAEPGGGEGGR